MKNNPKSFIDEFKKTDSEKKKKKNIIKHLSGKK